MNLKRVLSFLCVLTMLATMFVAPSQAATSPSIKIGEYTVKQGTENATVSVPVEFTGDITLAALQVEIAFDASVSFSK